MPGIYEITCTQCPWTEQTSESSTWVALRDGTQEVCPHPGERRTAEERTGESWNALVRAGRLHYRYAFVCRDCGTVEHYELTALARGGHIASIVRRPLAVDAQGIPCRKCQARALIPIVDPPLGLLVSVPLTLAVASVFGTIGTCGKAVLDLAIDGKETALGTAAPLLGIAAVTGVLVRLAYRSRTVHPAVACPACRTGMLRMRMVARS